MSFLYLGQVEFKHRDTGANTNPSPLPTLAAIVGIRVDGTSEVVSGGTITNLRTGIFQVQVTATVMYRSVIFVVASTDAGFDQSGNVVDNSSYHQHAILAGIAGIPNAVWSFAGRTLTGFGTLAADIAAAVWTAGGRTLTGFSTLVADILAAILGALPAKIWSFVYRTMTSTPQEIIAQVTHTNITQVRGST